MINKKIIFCSIIFIFLLAGFVNAGELNTTKAYSWLYEEMEDRSWNAANVEELALSVFVLNTEGYDIRAGANKLANLQRGSDGSWNGNIKDTVFAILALDSLDNSLGYDVDEGIDWVESQQKKNDRDGIWLIQIHSLGDGCSIRGSIPKIKDIIVTDGINNKCNDYWLDVENCLNYEIGINANFNVECTTDKGASLLYVLGNDYYLIDQDAGYFSRLNVENGCFGACDYKSTAYASWLLDMFSKPIYTKAYVYSNYDNGDAQDEVEDLGLAYLFTKDSNLARELEFSGNNEVGYWNEGNLKDTAFALFALNKYGGITGDVDINTRNYLGNQQKNDGSIGSNRLATAWTLMNYLGGDHFEPPIIVNPEINETNETYLACVNDACVLVEGNITNECAINANCINQTINNNVTCNNDGNCSFGESHLTCPGDCPDLSGGGAVCGDYVVLDSEEECDARYDVWGDKISGDDSDCPGLCDSDCTCEEEPSDCDEDTYCDWSDGETCSCGDCEDEAWCLDDTGGGTGGEGCSTDSDCTSSKVCDTLSGDCVECLTDIDCDVGYTCSFNQCEAEATCNYDETCDSDELCSCSDCFDDSRCKEDSGEFPWWIISILFLILVGVGGYFGYMKYQKGGKFSFNDMFKFGGKKNKTSFADYLKGKGKTTKPMPSRPVTQTIARPNVVRQVPRKTQDSEIEKALDQSIKKAKDLLKGK